MILCTTVKKLAAAGAMIYRVDIPAYAFKGNSIGAFTDFFANPKAAEKLATANLPFGGARGIVTAVPCTMADHYMLT